MPAYIFRQFYDYHFSENRKLWDSAILALSQEQFTRHIDYSVGSVRNQIVHLINVDDAWFCGLRGIAIPEPLNPLHFDERARIRAHWDTVERQMREYLAALHDDMLETKPFVDEEDKDLRVWQVLLHVVNHGTDHRAQILKGLSDLGGTTGPQDYIFYVYDNLSL
ncbi:MAG: hypothetical protein HC914_15750 [Chloroflexaceae bacterium]|nr:hypothetical protein [Chloroflexaceae bacterium]